MIANRNTMGLALAAMMSVAAASHGAVVLSDNFDTYTNGTLAGQGGWTLTPTATATPIQVAGAADKFAAVKASGQDDYKAFTSAVTRVDGEALYTSATISVGTPSTGGDYFVHLSNPAGSANFFQRLFARSATGGFQLGLVDASGTGSTPTYGTTVLSLNTEYRVAVAWNFVAGPMNDTFAVFVDPAPTTPAANVPYLTHTWTSSTVAEPAALAAGNLRQGNVTASVDDLAVATTFAEVVPEPTTLAALAGLATLAARRRR